MQREDMYAHWLCSAHGIGSKTVIKLLEKAGTPGEIYRQCGTLVKDPAWGLTNRQAESLLWQKRKVDPEQSYVNLINREIGFVWMGREEYPARLREIPDPPAALYYKGRLLEQQNTCVSVVGARDCSAYGKYMAEEFGKKLAESGAVVISGLARGIDGISQKAALEQGGRSVAVMGCGVDICYPAGNRDIYNMLLQNGAVVSEYAPGTEPVPQLFPARNRIISGLSDVLVVVEARAKSGTLITVDMALEQGRDVYVVPGRVTDPLSIGCNELLKQGAGVITSVEEFVAHVCSRKEREKPVPGINDSREETSVPKAMSAQNPDRRKVNRPCASEKNGNDAVPPLAQRVLGLLDSNPKTADELYERVSADGAVSLQELLTVLLELCMEGAAEQIGGSYGRTFR